MKAPALIATVQGTGGAAVETYVIDHSPMRSPEAYLNSGTPAAGFVHAQKLNAGKLGRALLLNLAHARTLEVGEVEVEPDAPGTPTISAADRASS